MSAPLKVLLDANVIMSSMVTDLLLTAEELNLVESFSSPDILAEVGEHAPDVWGRHGADPQYYLSQVKAYLEANGHLAFGYKWRIPHLVLPDPDDRHVLAAAIECGAGAIVTWNLRDFPQDRLSRFSLQAVDPDSLFTHLYTRDPARVMDVIDTIVEEKQHPPRTLKEEIHGLHRMGLTHFSTQLEHRYQK